MRQPRDYGLLGRSATQAGRRSGRMSTVVDAGGGIPGADRNRELSTVVDAVGGVPEAGRSRENVYCGRCRWWRPGSGSQQRKCLLWSMPVAVSPKRTATGNCLLWSMPLVTFRKRAAAGEMSTVVDAGGGIPEADRNREFSTVVDSIGDVPGAGRSKGNVYCGRCRWWRPGSGSQQRNCLLWSIALVTSRERAAAGEMSTVVDASGGTPGADRNRERVYCGR